MKIITFDAQEHCNIPLRGRDSDMLNVVPTIRIDTSILMEEIWEKLEFKEDFSACYNLEENWRLSSIRRYKWLTWKWVKVFDENSYLDWKVIFSSKIQT